MGKLERLAAARERVKKWKVEHPKSVFWQRQRWYERKKEAKTKERGIKIALRVSEVSVVEGYGELHNEDMALVEGDPEVVRQHARAVSRRTGREIPVSLMEPEGGGGRGNAKNIWVADERGIGQADGGGSQQKTAHEKKIDETLEVFKAKRAARERRGVAVPELEL